MTSPFSTIQNVFPIVAKSGIADTKWLYYACLGRVVLEEYKGHFPVFREMFVPWPSDLELQREIAKTLGSLDDKIELNRRMCATLEEIARAIFRSWFVDFDPVRAKIAAKAEVRDPERAAMAAICGKKEADLDALPAETLASLRATAALFPSGFTDSALGVIPEGWSTLKISAIAPLSTTSVNPQSLPDILFQHFSIPAFDAGRMPSIEPGSSIKSNKYKVSHNSVLVSKLNPNTPRAWLPHDVAEYAICSTEFMQFVPSQVEMTRYVYLQMLMPEMQDEILKRATGSTGSRQRAQPSQIEAMPIVVPPAALLKLADSMFQPLLQRVATARKEGITLAALRDTLLPKLLSGELRLHEDADEPSLDDKLLDLAPWQESVIGWLQDPGAVFREMFADAETILRRDPATDLDFAEGLVADLISEDYDGVYLNIDESERFEYIATDLAQFIGKWRIRVQKAGLLADPSEATCA